MRTNGARTALLGSSAESFDLTVLEPSENSPDLPAINELIEKLADVEHERWAHWQRYLHSKCVRASDGSLTIPPELVLRWELQIDTPYSELSEEEKESDRDQVRRYLSIIAEYSNSLNFDQ